MFDLFYTLFKYKEKSQKDILGNYPEKVNVPAFPERRFLWTSRMMVILSVMSICLTIILGGILRFMLPLRNAKVMPLQIDYERYQVIRMEEEEFEAFAGNLATESVMADYVVKRYTIGDSLDELLHRLGENEFVHLASEELVYDEFKKTELAYFEFMQRQGIRRKVKINLVYPVSFNFWQVRFETIDSIPGKTEPLIKSWIASIRMSFNFSKYEDKDLGLKNPFGTTIHTYNLTYMGSNEKGKRN